jgi:hypothetical protein
MRTLARAWACDASTKAELFARLHEPPADFLAPDQPRRLDALRQPAGMSSYREGVPGDVPLT